MKERCRYEEEKLRESYGGKLKNDFGHYTYVREIDDSAVKDESSMKDDS